MKSFNPIYYRKISECLQYMETSQKSSFNQLAKGVQLETENLKNVFSKWGVENSEEFLNYLHQGYLQNVIGLPQQPDLFNQNSETDFSDFKEPKIRIIPLNENGILKINYSFQDSPFGKMLIATTNLGICYLSYKEDSAQALEGLKNTFHLAELSEKTDEIQERALQYFAGKWEDLKEIPLHLKGTEFQLKVWNALLQVPFGKLCTYHHIAELIGNPKASRAAGTAIGSNNVAYFVPCHRAIQSTGNFGKYKWDAPRKAAIIGWEHEMVLRSLQKVERLLPAGR